MIHLDTISYHHGAHRILDDISLHIDTSRALGILGTSGSGKTTLARIIAGLYKPTSGSMSRFGSARAGIMRDIQMVFQDARASFNPDFTAYAALSEPLVCAKQRDIDRQIHSILDLVCLDRHILDHRCSMLSGGMLQRLSIARAMILRPRVIILDEATSSLDVIVAAQILNMLAQAKSEYAYIIITHDMRVIQKLCDDVVVLDDGRIVEQQRVVSGMTLQSSIGAKLQRAILPATPMMG